MRLLLGVALVALAAPAIAGKNDPLCFGDHSMSSSGTGAYKRTAQRICVAGPAVNVEGYVAARKASFEQPDPEEVKRRQSNVIFEIPATAYRGINFPYPMKKIIFTKKGTKDVVLEIPVMVKEVPLQNTFGANRGVGYEGVAEIGVDEFAALNPAKGEFDFNLTFDTDKPEWALFTDKWKGDYYARILGTDK